MVTVTPLRPVPSRRSDATVIEPSVGSLMRPFGASTVSELTGRVTVSCPPHVTETLMRLSSRLADPVPPHGMSVPVLSTHSVSRTVL
jgi:hypothetical protein